MISRVVAQELAPQSGAGVAPTLSGNGLWSPLDINLKGGLVVQIGAGVRWVGAPPAPFHNQIFANFLMCLRLCFDFKVCLGFESLLSVFLILSIYSVEPTGRLLYTLKEFSVFPWIEGGHAPLQSSASVVAAFRIF